jgi:hypothetical protein
MHALLTTQLYDKCFHGLVTMKLRILLLLLLLAQYVALASGQAGRIVGFRLVRAPSGTFVTDLVDGAVFYLNGTTPSYTIVAVPEPSSAGRIRTVLFGWNSKSRYRTEKIAPYTLCGGRSYNVCKSLKAGVHTVTATPNGGTPFRITFTISNGRPPPTVAPRIPPVPPPKPAPISPARSPLIVEQPIFMAPPAPAPKSVVAPVGPIAAPQTIEAPKAAAPIAPQPGDPAPSLPMPAPTSPKQAPVSPTRPPFVDGQPIFGTPPVEPPKVAPALAPKVPTLAPKVPTLAPKVPTLTPKDPALAPTKAPTLAPNAPTLAPKVVTPAPKAPVTLPPTPPPTYPAIYINCGGGTYIDVDRNKWDADTFYSGGTAITVPTPVDISQTLDDELYWTYRQGDVSYTIPVVNGLYTVTVLLNEFK